jgi:hypothetical protein
MHACSSDAFESVAEDETFMDIDNGLDELIKANCPSIEGCSGSPLIADHKVAGLLTSVVHSVDVYRTVPTLKAVFQLWLHIEETVSVQKLVMWYMFILYSHY